MPTPPDSQVNPYAPPVSDVDVQVATDDAKMKRPKSVKWAIGILLFFTLVFSLLNGLFIYHRGTHFISHEN